MGNGKAKELLRRTHGHELRWGMLVGGVLQGRRVERVERNGTTVIA